MRTLILSLITLLSFSCAKKEEATEVNFRSTFASMANGFDGGLILYGKKMGTNSHFARIIIANDLVEEIPNGNWNFYLIGWLGDGFGNMISGLTQCAVQKDVTLNGGAADIHMNMSNINCTHTDFGPTYIDNAGSGSIVFMNDLRLESPAVSAISAIEFNVKSFNKVGSNIDGLSGIEYKSDCISLAPSGGPPVFDVFDRSGSALEFNYPSGKPGSPFTVHIGFHDSASCSNDERGTLLLNGLIGVGNSTTTISGAILNEGIQINYAEWTDIPDHD